jgi:hypothetical protein
MAKDTKMKFERFRALFFVTAVLFLTSTFQFDRGFRPVRPFGGSAQLLLQASRHAMH